MNPRDHAERAVLGAILNDPRQLRGLDDWLAPEDFRAPQHAELYRAMLLLDERDRTPDLTGLPVEERGQALARYGMSLIEHLHASGTRGVDPPYLHTLMRACPHVEHAPHYGRMVVEADTHRTIVDNATRLAGLVHEQLDAPFGLGQLFVHAAAFRQVIDNLAWRWGLDPDDHAGTDASRRTANTRRVNWSEQLAPELDAARVPDQRAAAEREDTLLACILRTPGQIDQVRDYLASEDFHAPGRGELYAAATAMHDRGDALDPVTLMWEAQQHGILERRTAEADDALAGAVPILSADHLMHLFGDGQPAGVAPYYARQILEASILTTATEAAGELKNLAQDPALGIPDLLSVAAHRIDDINGHEHRWQRATGQTDRHHDAAPQPGDEQTVPESSERRAL